MTLLSAASVAAPAPDLCAELNPEQRAAVQHGTGDQAIDSRPLLVIAGAGSGKTNTLAHRVANLIAHGADPQRMLLLTFSRRAAEEMARRAERIVPKADLERLLLGADAEVQSNALEVHVSSVRRKLGRELIETVRGLGYRMPAP